LIRPERVLALADELVIHLVRAHDVVELLEREVEDVFLLTKHVGLHEALGFFQQGLLVLPALERPYYQHAYRMQQAHPAEVTTSSCP